MRMPAPSPVFGSAPQAPRCSKFFRIVSDCWMIVWDLRPLISTTKPTPQASCSYAGSYRPCRVGIPKGVTDTEFVWSVTKFSFHLFEAVVQWELRLNIAETV